ncbi:MAG: metal-dependent hydrolase [Candidatus Eisenbacteria bacterium]
MPQATFLGHACVALHEEPWRLIIDPFLTGNPLAAARPEQLQVHYILVTHGHGDHLGDAIAIARRTAATIIATHELACHCARAGAKTHGMHIGGAHAFEFGRVKLTIAHHGGGGGEDASLYTGPSVGFLVTLGGRTVYHAGDTGLFYDMKLIGELDAIDLAFLPIGDNYTMGIADAVKAVELLRPARAVPMHYDTFPAIAADPRDFAARVRGTEVVILAPGESVSF